MRKLLFVHEERYLELAIRNVQELLDFEQRLSESNTVSDLLAALLISSKVVNEFLSQKQYCDLSCLTDSNMLFGPASVSLNGVWILVTLLHEEFQEPRTRHEALDRVLDILRIQGLVRDSEKVFLAHPTKGPHMSIGK
jgi:hypothetical protein